MLPIIKPAAATWHLDSSLSPLFSFLFRRLRIAGDDSRCCYQFPKLTLPAPPLVEIYYFFFVVSDTPLPSFHRINKSGKLRREVGTERERQLFVSHFSHLAVFCCCLLNNHPPARCVLHKLTSFRFFFDSSSCSYILLFEILFVPVQEIRIRITIRGLLVPSWCCTFILLCEFSLPS